MLDTKRRRIYIYSLKYEYKDILDDVYLIVCYIIIILIVSLRYKIKKQQKHVCVT